jgi:tetratricopeptide (TPR) repeat protein
MHKNDEAIRMYEKALEINPNFDEAVQEIQKLKNH